LGIFGFVALSKSLVQWPLPMGALKPNKHKHPACCSFAGSLGRPSSASCCGDMHLMTLIVSTRQAKECQIQSLFTSTCWLVALRAAFCTEGCSGTAHRLASTCGWRAR
jgi:hypothetical protein